MYLEPRDGWPEPSTGPRLEGIDPSFVFDFTAYDDPDDTTQRWSTWLDVEPLCRGPEPLPDWVVTSQAAIDTELGILKTGKEADVFLLERAVPDGESVVMAAKRYRDPEHRNFHRSAAYTDGRKVRKSRDRRALAKKTAHGRAVAAGQWAWAEWESLKRLWELGLPVPYPVQIDGTELLMEWITADGETAPRLAQTRPAPDLLASYFDQVRDVLGELARHGIVHGDLSPYNILAAGERWSSSTCPRSSTWSATPPAWTSCCATAPTSAGGSAREASRSTSRRCSGSWWRTRSDPIRRSLGCRHEAQPRPGGGGRHPRGLRPPDRRRGP